jgi:hypothetical protein
VTKLMTQMQLAVTLPYYISARDSGRWRCNSVLLSLPVVTAIGCAVKRCSLQILKTFIVTPKPEQFTSSSILMQRKFQLKGQQQ